MFDFYAYRNQIAPIYNFIIKIDAKLDKIAGKPTPTERRLREIDTIFVARREIAETFSLFQLISNPPGRLFKVIQIAF